MKEEVAEVGVAVQYSFAVHESHLLCNGFIDNLCLFLFR